MKYARLTKSVPPTPDSYSTTATSSELATTKYHSSNETKFGMEVWVP